MSIAIWVILWLYNNNQLTRAIGKDKHMAVPELPGLTLLILVYV